MKNIKELLELICATCVKSANGEMTPSQARETIRCAEAAIKAVRLQIIGAEHAGKKIEPDFLKTE